MQFAKHSGSVVHHFSDLLQRFRLKFHPRPKFPGAACWSFQSVEYFLANCLDACARWEWSNSSPFHLSLTMSHCQQPIGAAPRTHAMAATSLPDPATAPHSLQSHPGPRSREGCRCRSLEMHLSAGRPEVQCIGQSNLLPLGPREVGQSLPRMSQALQRSVGSPQPPWPEVGLFPYGNAACPGHSNPPTPHTEPTETRN